MSSSTQDLFCRQDAAIGFFVSAGEAVAGFELPLNARVGFEPLRALLWMVVLRPSLVLQVDRCWPTVPQNRSFPYCGSEETT